MIRNYLNIAFRILWRNKVYSLINIFGLAIGLCSSIIVFLYVQNEFSYDKFHNDADRVYRFIMLEEDNGSILAHPYCRLPLGPALKMDFPEILETSRVREGSADLSFKDKVFPKVKVLHVDSSFLELFNFPLIEGYANTVLQGLNSVVLSETLAKKIFGDLNPIGRSINTQSDQTLIVTGIVKNPPANTKFQFEALAPIDVFVNSYHYNFSWDGGPEFDTYVKLYQSTNADLLKTKFAAFFEKHNKGSEQDGYLQPLTEMHLHSSNMAYTDNEQRYSEVILFAVIAVFILLIAIINYVNLSTSRSIERAKEVGIKKVVGANRMALIRQFFAESYIVVLISIFIALILVEIFLPHINHLLNKNLNLYHGNAIHFILMLPCFFILVGGLSAIYPALYLSSFNPIKVLKGGLSSKAKSKLRTGLVVFQFTIAAVLISITIYSLQQMNYILKKDRGYEQKNLVAVMMNSEQVRDKFKVIKSEILNLPGVLNVAASSNYPGYDFTANGYTPEEYTEPILIKLLKVDYDYFNTMDMKIMEGRGFSDNMKADEYRFVINETLAKMLNWKNPIGKTIKRNANKYTVIGVVKDFHFNTLQKAIEPLIITVQTSKYFSYFVLNVRLDGKNNANVLEEIEAIMKKTDQTQVFDYVFLDAQHKDIYASEYSFSRLFQLFSLLAICIACLGLFGLAAYTAEQRIKEIGIRKALGASTKSLLIMLFKQYLYILLLGNIIAAPLVIYAVRSWQNNYAYFINMQVVVFVFSFIISLVIAASIVLMISRRVIYQNPVNALKCE